jgi:peroxiredoxin
VRRTVAAGAAATPPVTLGSKLPDVELSYFDSEHQLQRLSTKDLCSGKKARRLCLCLCVWELSAPPSRCAHAWQLTPEGGPCAQVVLFAVPGAFTPTCRCVWLDSRPAVW